MAVEVRGGSKFHAVARRLKGAANNKALVKELRDSITAATPALKEAVRANAAAYLPDAYAAELVPSLQFRTNTSTAGDQVTVRLTVTARGNGGHARQVGVIEDGTLRHPVWGRTRKLRRHHVHKATSRVNPWVAQQVKAGFASEPMAEQRPAVRQQIEGGVDRVLDQIAKG